jgi:hypothetical protein
MQKDYQRIWHEIVQGYTALKLTHRSDRQPAILGLAREMARKRRGRYLEGLWEDSLITDLAWRVGWTLDITQRIKGEDGGTKGPSWSWTSIDAPCKYWGNWVDGDTTVLNIKSSDPSDSRQTHTLLTVRGRLVSGTSNHYEYGPYGMRISSELWFCSSFGVSPADESAYFKPDVNCPPFVPDGEPVFCLALGFSSYFSHKFEVGLVLRCIDSKEQFFERIGIFDLKLSGPNEVAHKLLATQELATINLV